MIHFLRVSTIELESPIKKGSTIIITSINDETNQI